MNKIILIPLIFLIFSLQAVCQNAKDDFNKTKKIEERLKDNYIYKEQLEALQAKKDSLLPVGHFLELNAIYQDILSLTKMEADTLNMVSTLLDLSYFHFDYNKLDTAENYAIEIENILKHKKDKEGYYSILAESKFALAIIYSYSDKVLKELENGLIANQYFLKVKDKEKIKPSLMSNYLFLAGSYAFINDDEAAINSLESAIALYEKDKNLELELIDCYIILSTIYFKHSPNKGINYLEKALEFAMNLNRYPLIIKSLTLLGKFNYHIDKEAALGYFNKALKLSKKEKLNGFAISNYNELSNFYIEYRNDPIALKYADSALALNKVYNDANMNSKALLLKSNFYQQNNQYDVALKFLKDNLNYLKIKNSPYLIENAYRAFFNFYNERGDMNQCERYYNKYTISKEKKETSAKASKLELLEVSYKYREAASKLEREKIALQLSELDKKRIKIKSYFTNGIVFLTLMFIIIIVIKQKKQAKIEKTAIQVREELLLVKKEALDKEIEFKNKSVTDFALQINEKNELLKNLKSELKQVKPLNSNSKHILTDAIIHISDDIEQNEEKVQLYMEVNKKNNEFELKINEKYPDLTDKERKILTRVRLGQGSKQIANQLNITAASVDNYRYQIRKKIKVSKGKSLETFINDL